MTARYNGSMHTRQPLPFLWLISDARNDAVLEDALAALPPNSAFVFRHYHLNVADRSARFAALADVAHSLGHLAIFARDAELARALGADGIYGSPDVIAPVRDMLKLAAVHNGDEMQRAIAAKADGIFLSPVFPTASHPGGASLGEQGFSVLSQQSSVPVIALGGMTMQRAADMVWPRWGAIDGLTPTAN